MNKLELMKYRYCKTDTLKDKFLDAFRAITEYEHSIQPAKTHLDKLHYHLLNAVNNIDSFLEKQSVEIGRVEDEEAKYSDAYHTPVVLDGEQVYMEDWRKSEIQE